MLWYTIAMSSITVDPKRIQIVRAQEGAGPVLYWMNREMRVEDNWSLLYACELAQKKGTHVEVVYNLIPGYLGGGIRQTSFKLDCLEEVEKALSALGISFHLIVDTPENKKFLSFLQKSHYGTIVTDMHPLRHTIELHQQIRAFWKGGFCIVDSHNITPVWETSPKKEYAAYSIRPKIWKKTPNFLTAFPRVPAFHQSDRSIDWKELRESLVTGDTRTFIRGGSTQAHIVLKQFLTERLSHYADKRNDMTLRMQSELSPYIHYGAISSQRIVLETLAFSGKKIEDCLHKQKNGAKPSTGPTSLLDNVRAFFEELIVRKELSDNFCYYEPRYDTLDVAPEWARTSLRKHQTDTRQYVYTTEEFEKAKTHDPLWNACQQQMVQTGCMHGYMRMYWAKKILEWTRSAEEALEIAIYLNDRYELDGRDPNGYAGILWSIAGLHDRAWFERPIFGLVRYMSYESMRKKYDIQTYIDTYTT